LGLGLSICRSIIEAHGGRLCATADQPRGAIFHFTLPCQPRSATGDPAFAFHGVNHRALSWPIADISL
jgi:K+-sensing histidine kinase KdpD